MRARWLKSRARQRVGVPFRILRGSGLPRPYVKAEAHKFHNIPFERSRAGLSGRETTNMLFGLLGACACN